MITNREIADAANEWQIRHDVVEKDYVLGWLLAGIAAHRATERWAFKGGTCLRKRRADRASTRVLAPSVVGEARVNPEMLISEELQHSMIRVPYRPAGP